MVKNLRLSYEDHVKGNNVSFPHSFNHYDGSTCKCNKTSKYNAYKLGRKKKMLCNDTIVYIKNVKKKLKKTLLISSYSNVAGYKANMQMSITFLYTSNE